MATKYKGKPAKVLKDAFEEAAKVAPPGGSYKVEIYVTTEKNPIGDYTIVLTPGTPPAA